MPSDLIREFCKGNNCEVVENYSEATFLGEMVTTLAIVVNQTAIYLMRWHSLSHKGLSSPGTVEDI